MSTPNIWVGAHFFGERLSDKSRFVGVVVEHNLNEVVLQTAYGEIALELWDLNGYHCS